MSTASTATPGPNYDLMLILKLIGMKASCIGASLSLSVSLCLCHSAQSLFLV